MQLAELHKKKIIVGITGGIAAYKSLLLIRLLIRSGAEVRVVMTPTAQDFVTPLTVSTLSKHPVVSDLVSEGTWENHVEMGLWADAMIIAPATANTLAAMAHGTCDNMLLATYLSARCPVLAAPAMDLDMWAHPATERNIAVLQKDGVKMVDVGSGELASGLSGKGRMAEPEDLLAAVEEVVTDKMPEIEGKKVIVTAGPTYESLDPVRFLGNWSSGKMGVAIAEQFHLRGAEVTLILGPSALTPRFGGIEVVRVQSAREMYEEAVRRWPETEIGVMAAAVADYRPAGYSEEKIKKTDDDLVLRLERNPDIAATLGHRKSENQVLVGFAMETQDEIKSARNKLSKKNFDLIVLNSLKDEGAGFATDTNKVTFIWGEDSMEVKDLKSKQAVALDIVEFVSNYKKI